MSILVKTGAAGAAGGLGMSGGAGGAAKGAASGGVDSTNTATITGATVLALNVRETVVTANSGGSFGHQVLFGVTAAPGPALAGQAQRMVSAMAAMGGGAAGTASGLATTAVAGATNLAAPSGVRPHPV